MYIKLVWLGKLMVVSELRNSVKWSSLVVMANS